MSKIVSNDKTVEMVKEEFRAIMEGIDEGRLTLNSYRIGKLNGTHRLDIEYDEVFEVLDAGDN